MKTGTILLATSLLDGTNFDSAVVLIVINNEEGAFGLILNRSSVMPINEVFEPTPKVIQKKRRFYFGGPVDDSSLHILRLVPHFTGEGYPFTTGVELGGNWNSMEELLITDEKHQRLFLGYTGWGKDELEKEVENNHWEVYSNINIKKLLEDWLIPPISTRDALKKELLERNNN
jgi:putative transcriptional regulator